ncbi:unnamed protein product [Rotaria socialis]|uniref:Uncharacterized protein n=1 Tax=Rotaria socialis TaxID=392032 RepID=A0A818SEF2_9BILA|nr:unnamed protein product [Rotaria socialis]CAF3401878.1 unnamed protein product [Rotaria socialis]CAF3666156.1 unnamed protein product [Rotaria socialis]CAF4514920.1 unnamed protein product [Rotaria socialis]CAF4525377.1 unnamed protein product [Rotaria socialis]
MKSTSIDKDELISVCEIEYEGNPTELATLREFKQNYSSEQSNIDFFFLFRFFIRDLEQQLDQHRCSSPLRLYRGQLISNEELQ